MGDFQPESSALSPRERSHAYKGLVGFLKNAWRKEKMRGEYHRLTSMSLSNEIEKAKLQISVLKSIVKSDETILADWVRDVQASKVAVEKLKKEKKEMVEEKNHIQRQLEIVQRELEEQKIELLNEKNNFLLAKNEADALGEQLDKEREKILKLKKEKQELLDKVNQDTSEE